MDLFRRIIKWLTGPVAFQFIITILGIAAFLLFCFMLCLVIAVCTANLQRMVLDQEPVFPTWPINELTQLVNSLEVFLSRLAGWSGLFTLLAAIYAGRKALQVSDHRKAEAEATEFRDSMKWAAEHINLDATDPREMIQSNWALSLIEKYVDNPPSSLSEYDREMAEQLLEEIAASVSSSENNP